MRRIASGRIVGLLIAVIGIGVSVWCARDALRMNAEFHEWLGACPMETAVDLSQSGETTAPFHQTCSISHGEALFLKCDLDDVAKQKPEELFEELSGSVVIEDVDGNEIESVKINSKTAQYWDGKVMLTGFAPFQEGAYVATIRVDSGAPALAGKQQTIYAKYQLCGLEEMPAMIAGAFAFGAGMIGFVSAACVLPGLLRCGFWKATSAGMFVALWFLLTAQSGEARGETFHVRSLGRPTAEKGEAARKINELMLFEGRLYLGHGDWFKNTGSTDVIYYDFDRQEFVNEFTVDEEAVVRYRRYGNRLFLPGIDSTESWEFGNLYVRDASGWRKYRTIPRGLHVFDFAEYSGRWYVATGSNFGNLKTGPAIGAIYSSGDEGTTWRYEYTTASALGTVHRVTSLMPYQGRLFAFGYADGPMPREWNAEQDRSGDGTQYNRVGESVVYDGAGWFRLDVIPAKLVQTIEPHVFGDRLLLCVRTGRYGDQFTNEWLLFAYDGKNAHRVPLECDRIRDTLVKDDRVILLLTRQGENMLAESSDLAHWDFRSLRAEIEEPLSVEYDGRSYYLGLDDGTVLAATVSAD